MKKEIIVKTARVMEARALAELVAIAGGFSSKISIRMDSRTVNAKSIMGIMGLGLDIGKMVILEAEGTDEQAALTAMEEFLS